MKKIIIAAILLSLTASMMRSGNCCLSSPDDANDQETCVRAQASLLLLRNKAFNHDAESKSDLLNFGQKLADPTFIVECFSAYRLRRLGLLNSNNKVPKAIRDAFDNHSQYGSLDQ